MTDLLIAIGLCIASAAAAFFAMKTYKAGPYLEEVPGTPDLPPKQPQEPVKPPEAPIPPKPPVIRHEPIKQPRATLENFCIAIRDFEGLPGDANYRNNNPGNCRYNPGGYLPKYGNVRRSPAGFAIFPTYELGWLYLKEMVKGMIRKRPNQTIYEFIARYAPPEDHNDPDQYSRFIGKRLGVDSRTFKMKDLLV